MSELIYIPFDESKMQYQTDDPEALETWKKDLRKIEYFLWLIPYKSGIKFELESLGNSRVRNLTERIFGSKCYRHKGLVLPQVTTYDISKENLEKWMNRMTELWNDGTLKEQCESWNRK